jgi:leader peptidase (prepilin peptidase)/N-methyltransferase
MTFPWLFAGVAPALALTVALFAAVGAVVGSFVALVSLRWPAARPVAFARSACGGCGAVLGPRELVPLLSFAVQRGRCRRCGAAVPRRYPAVEAAAALIGGISALALPLPGAAAVAALGWTLLLLALLDAEHFWLPSAVTLPLAAAGLAATAWLRPAALVDHLIGAVAGWAVLALVAAAYRAVRGRVGLGGGDARLFAAAGAWLGWAALPLVLGSAALAGLAVAMLLWGRGLTATTRLPFGVFLAAAIWAVALRVI